MLAFLWIPDNKHRQISLWAKLSTRMYLKGLCFDHMLNVAQVDELTPTIGEIQRHGKLQIARYHQHSEECLDDKKTPLDFMMDEFPVPKVENTEWRKRYSGLYCRICFLVCVCVCAGVWIQPIHVAVLVVMVSRLGRYGVSGKSQTRKIGTLSDGQKTQLVFCWLAQQNPHLLLFDEPTNHLDMESIDG